jgi:hypothetical protein
MPKGASYASMTGSGSSVYGIFSRRKNALLHLSRISYHNHIITTVSFQIDNIQSNCHFLEYYQHIWINSFVLIWKAPIFCIIFQRDCLPFYFLNINSVDMLVSKHSGDCMILPLNMMPVV